MHEKLKGGMQVHRYFRAPLMLCAFFLAILFSPFAASGAAPVMDELFNARDWKAIDALLSTDSGRLSARELSLAANSLWIRGNWEESLKLLQRTSPHWPGSVKPYGTLMMILGLERTGRKNEARQAALKFLPAAPADIAYYVAFALYRLTGEDDLAGRRKYLQRMYSLAGNTQQQAAALTLLLALPGDKTAYALNLLNLQPRNASALKFLESLPKPWKADVSFAVGYASYLRGQHKKAVPLLKAVPLGSHNGRKARYYRAFSLYSQKKYGEALELWSTLARNGTTYAESSIRRISILAGRAQKDRALRVLREVAASRKGTIKARALYSLSTHSIGKDRRALEDKVIALIPDSAFTTRILFNRGWDRWNRGDIGGAVNEWEKSIASGMDSSWGPRVLYWIAQGYGRLKLPAKRTASLEKIRKNYPLSIYAFISGGEKLPIVPGIPGPLAGDKPSDLERWGFITYARWHLLARGDAKSLFRAASLAEWSGDHLAAYSAVGRIAGEITRGTSFFRKGMEYLYPRPFLKDVKKAAERFKVEENLIWSIMRQESAFNPNATSWVGAAGLMQLMPSTARSEAKSLEMKKYHLYNPAQNIVLGTSHIARLLKSFGNVEQAVAAYNGGGGSARRWLAGRKDVPLDEWIESVRFEETNDYVRRVMANLHIYRSLYGMPKTAETAAQDAAVIVSDDEAESPADRPGPEEKEDETPLSLDEGGK
jgi:soluble lytic murein transglycosylase